MKSKFYSADPYIFAKHCLDRYVALKAWKKPDDVIINIQEIYDEIIYPNYEIQLITNFDLGYAGEEKILGLTIMTKDTIYIDQSIAPEKNDRRYSTTLAHELGHALLHTEMDQNLKYTPDALALFDEYAFNELQADCFAEHLIMPHELLIYKLVQRYGAWDSLSYSGPGEYRINQANEYVSSLTDLHKKLAEPLTIYFSNVPTEALALVIQRMRFVDDKTYKPPVFNNSESRKSFMTKQTIGAFQAIISENNRKPPPKINYIRRSIP